jgi:hypothetical protein
MSDASIALIVVAVIGAGFVGLNILLNKWHKRILEQRRRRWAAMRLGESTAGGAAFGGATYLGGGGCSAGWGGGGDGTGAGGDSGGGGCCGGCGGGCGGG